MKKAAKSKHVELNPSTDNQSFETTGPCSEKGEIISPFSPAQVPPDFDFIASKTDEEKIAYMQSVLARSEDEAVALISPALKTYGSATWVVQIYLPLILAVKAHFCRPGRPRVNPQTGKRNRTWKEVCDELLGIGIRRMQQILRSLSQPKLIGKVSPVARKRAIDAREFECARRVAAPAASLAKAVVEKGLGEKFPEALQILNLADISVPVAQPVATVAEPDRKGILTGLLETLEPHGDSLPPAVVAALKSAQAVLHEEPQTAADAATEPTMPTQSRGGASSARTQPVLRAECDNEVLDLALGLKELSHRINQMKDTDKIKSELGRYFVQMTSWLLGRHPCPGSLQYSVEVSVSREVSASTKGNGAVSAIPQKNGPRIAPRPAPYPLLAPPKAASGAAGNDAVRASGPSPAAPPTEPMPVTVVAEADDQVALPAQPPASKASRRSTARRRV